MRLSFPDRGSEYFIGQSGEFNKGKIPEFIKTKNYIDKSFPLHELYSKIEGSMKNRFYWICLAKQTLSGTFT
jgi:hypothetical protein